jgi:hypothetical protein
MTDIAHMLKSGQLPPWFPPDKQIDFRGKRRDLLNSMTLDDLRATVEEIIEMHRDHFVDLNYWKHEYRAATINGIPDTVGHACAILARYLYAAWLGEDDGLPLLLGTEHAKQSIHGKVMEKGRKKGSIGPVRKFIRARLAKIHAATNAELWDAISKRPPKGWTVMDSPRLGRYIEGPSSDDEVKWKSFCTYAALERGLLKNP